jgi:hypothetical protein
MENSCVYRTLRNKRFGFTAIALLAASSVSAGATTLVPSQTFKAGTKIATALDGTVNSATLSYGVEFKLRIIDTSLPALDGGEIIGYVSEVDQPSGMSKAKITFFLTSIKLRNGEKKPISAYVVSRRVTPYDPMAVAQARRHMMAAPPMPNGTVTPGPIAWQMNVGSSGPVKISNRPSGLLGGTVYAASPHQAIVVPAGTPVTVELQQNLTIP